MAGRSTLSRESGPRDNRRLEARDDREHFDVFARLCDVDRRGRSRNITDGLVRVRPGEAALDAEGVRRVVVELFPTAYRFLPGHRVRLQVSAASHPRYARNLGSGEPLGTGTTMLVQSVGLHHDPVHPSALDLPVLERP